MVLTNNKYKSRWIIALAIGLCSFFSLELLSQSVALSFSAVSNPSSSFSTNDSIQNIQLTSLDGPYLYKSGKEARIVSVIQNGQSYQIVEDIIDLATNNSFECQVDNEDQDRFTFQLKNKIISPKSIYAQPEKLLAISDIEGNFNAFYSLLVNNGVMDKDYKWTFGKGHLVLTGDFMDRGNNVTQVLWLIYKLEQEAEKHGGVLHFILGNHEILNIQGHSTYADNKYIDLAQKWSGQLDTDKAFESLMSDDQELIQWMKSKNAMEKIGNILFVHGGISPQLVDSRFSIKKINYIIKRRLQNGPARDAYNKQNEDFLFAGLGPLWYRGLVTKYRRNYKKATNKEVDKALRKFKVDHISIGHTTVNSVSADFDGKILRTDVKHPDVKNHPKTQALLVIDQKMFKVDGLGNQEILRNRTARQN